MNQDDGSNSIEDGLAVLLAKIKPTAETCFIKNRNSKNLPHFQMSFSKILVFYF